MIVVLTVTAYLVGWRHCCPSLCWWCHSHMAWLCSQCRWLEEEVAIEVRCFIYCVVE